MPASRSASRGTDTGGRSFHLWLIAAAVLAALAFVTASLPASLVLRFLPGDLQATEPTGTLWHGSVPALSSHGRAMGAVEWRVHPASLLSGRFAAGIRWVRQDISVDAEVSASRGNITARSLRGGGSLASLADLGLTRGWNGQLSLELPELALTAGRISALSGTARLDALTSTDFPGIDFGSASLVFGPGAVQSDGTAIAQVSDTGGLLQLSGTLILNPAQNLATFSGWIKERAPLPGTLQQKLNELAQMRGRDAQGRIPLEIEFAL